MRDFDFLPKTLKSDLSALHRRLAIAEAAMRIPDGEKRLWDFLCATAVMTAQSRGIVAERLVCSVMKGEGVSASLDSGDFVFDGRHYEVKSSFTPGKMNIRQVRPWQDVDYLIVHANVEDPDDCYCYRLTHAQMVEELRLIGTVSHGTKAAVETNANREYSISLSTRGKRLTEATKRWAAYRDTALEILLFGDASVCAEPERLAA